MQTCILHLIRDTFHLASKGNSNTLERDLRRIYAAEPQQLYPLGFEDLVEAVEACATQRCVRLSNNAWQEFIVLDYDLEIRTVLCSTNAIESLDAATSEPSRPAALPEAAAALKCLYLVTES